MKIELTQEAMCGLGISAIALAERHKDDVTVDHLNRTVTIEADVLRGELIDLGYSVVEVERMLSGRAQPDPVSHDVIKLMSFSRERPIEP